MIVLFYILIFSVTVIDFLWPEWAQDRTVQIMIGFCSLFDPRFKIDLYRAERSPQNNSPSIIKTE